MHQRQRNSRQHKQLQQLQYTATRCYKILHAATYCNSAHQRQRDKRRDPVCAANEGDYANRRVLLHRAYLYLSCTRQRIVSTSTFQQALVHCYKCLNKACPRQVLHCVAVCCSVLQCVTLCCSVLQCVAVCCSVLHCAAVRCSVLQFVAECCSVLQCVAVCCNVLQCVAVCCSVLQRVVVSTRHACQ